MVSSILRMRWKLVRRGLAAEGRLILFITHRMDEVMALSDRISVLRGGRVVRTEERGASKTATT